MGSRAVAEGGVKTTCLHSQGKMGPVFDLLIHEDIEAKLTAALDLDDLR